MKFSEFNAPEKRWLAVDAAAPRPFAAVLGGNGEPLGMADIEGGALEGLAPATRKALDKAALPFAALDGYLFCEGPGSILSVRLAAMALRVWLAECKKPVFAWRTLPLLARAHAANGVEPPAVTVSRRGFWCVYRAPDDWRECDTAALAQFAEQRPLYLPQRKQWETPPHFLTAVSDNPARGKPSLLFCDALLRPCETPDAFVVRAPEYRRWNA